MSRSDVTIGVVGSGGDGVVTAGEILAGGAAREGVHCLMISAFGPQIRGGETSCTVRLRSDGAVHAQGDAVDVLAVLSWDDFRRFRSEIEVRRGGVVISDSDDPVKEGDEPVSSREAIAFARVPFTRLAKEKAGTPLAKNMVALGVLGEALGLPAAAMRGAIEKRYAKKQAVREANVKGFDAGLEHGRALDGTLGVERFAHAAGKPLLLLSGNEAVALGALYAGCRFFAGYPITPSSEVLQFLSEWLPVYGGKFIQAEDELAALGLVIGASLAGTKAMTATSGPGLSLMSEMMGLAAMSEVPAVIVDVQRGGPATGIPTKSEQSDLFHAVFGGHGDLPRVVLAPTDVADCYAATVDAFNIAEEFQTPVIVLSDQFVGQRKEATTALPTDMPVVDRLLPAADELGTGFLRYRESANGVSPMSVVGMKGGEYQTAGIEHDELGHPTSMVVLHEQMSAKRYKKLEGVAAKYAKALTLGPERARVGVVAWGSSYGAVRDALAAAEREGIAARAFLPRLIQPFPGQEFAAFLASVERLIVVELSFAAQFDQYLRTIHPLPADRTVLKRSGGAHLRLSEVLHAIREASR
ncbi:MAG TPA: 2-oxoacid:acceptor oxidoreductase subunit alpha [Thermoanaerobaculaceae bacterium]|nr:2-oxoacid:acceptor oxidoreductase subunit alpha [Thermoanaerobaculaceae bacterium]